jgi:CBS domain-containing protein/sporulation protein YlmC with PRC-barrel domain
VAGIALSELLGALVRDPSGAVAGRVREVAIAPQEDGTRVTALVVRTRAGMLALPPEKIGGIGPSGVRAMTPLEEWPPFSGSEGLLLLERDLLDQQVIDVHGRKVVRVNDVEFEQEAADGHVQLRVNHVDVGVRGAIRRLLKGMVPFGALRAVIHKIPAHAIPWAFVDLIETDPARRVKLKISHDRLAKLHPADIADILEELAPAEREAVFETLDEEVAAGALEEIDPKLQKSLVEALDHDRAADIVEEMNPDAAADLLGDLPEETTVEILEEMEPEEREEVAELLEFGEHTAAGRMTTEYLALPPTATVNDGIELLRRFEGGIESISTIYLVEREKLAGAVPLAKLPLATPDTPLAELSSEPLIFGKASASDEEVSDLFDKYNLLALPVVDADGRLVGVITADDVISLLRSKL